VIRAALAGGLYALALLVLGFMLGTARVLIVAPLAGELVATLIELPVMLTAAFFACRWIVRRWAISADPAGRLIMGLSFLALLLGLETILGLTLLGRTWPGQLAAFASPAGMAGLAAQVVSALMPMVVGPPRQL
jgi:hypothetical protein